MIIKELAYSRSAKVNTGKYENRDFHVGVVVQIEDGEDHDAVLARVRKWVKDKLTHDVNTAAEE